MKYFVVYFGIQLILSTLFEGYEQVHENDVNAEFVNDYFIERDLRVAIAFACTSRESLTLVKALMTNRTVLSKYDFFESEKSFLIMIRKPYFKIGIYLNYSCAFGKSVFAMSSKYRLFKEEYVWILVNDNQSVIYDLETFNLQLDSDIIFAVVYNKTNRNVNIELYDIYKIGSNTPIIITQAGSWNTKSKLRITLEGSKTARRSNFQGVTIDGVGVLNQLNLKVRRHKASFSDIMNIQYENHLDVLNRFAFTMNMNLAMMYNFTINVTFVDDWGVKTPDGTYNGMLGEIESGRSELGLSTVIMNTSLMDLMDFSFPIWKFRPMFIFRNPRSFGTYQALLVPFEGEVWIFIVCLIIFLISVLTFVKHFNVNEQGEEKNDIMYKSWSENFVTIIGAFSAQGLASCSSRVSERIILYMSLIVGMLLYTFYNSMVVTSLLQPPPPNIHSCEQLIDSGINIGITNITYYVKYFQTSNDELTKRIFKKALDTNGFMSPEEGMHLVKSKDFAFYGEEATVYPIINDMYVNNDICRLVEVELVTPYYLPCPYRKESPLKQFVNSGLHLMRETGIVMRERKQWHKSKPICQGQNDVPSIQFQTLIVAYIILLTGVCLSIVIFVAEVFIHKRSLKIRLTKKKRNVEELINNYKSNFEN